MDPETSPRTLLVIEDQASLRANLALLLDFEGFRVLTAPDGIRGLELARSERPDLVLCDLMMPGLDGRGVVRALRSDPTFDAVPVLFLTARGDPADREEARALGADGYLTKPVVRDDLVAEVTTRLREGRSPGFTTEVHEDGASGDQRESLSILLTGTDILRHHGASLSEAERIAQREAMLAAAARLSAERGGDQGGSAKN